MKYKRTLWQDLFEDSIKDTERDWLRQFQVSCIAIIAYSILLFYCLLGEITFAEGHEIIQEELGLLRYQFIFYYLDNYAKSQYFD